MEGNSKEIVIGEQQNNEEQEVVLKDKKGFLCKKPQIDVEMI